jgi:ABC-type transport system substrate-binding protein
LKSFVPNETTDFTRFDQYYEKDEKTGDRLPYINTIHIRKMVEESVRWTALRAGDIDVLDTPRCRSTPGVKTPVMVKVNKPGPTRTEDG